jgi:2-polyprenyl-3-methyl-5-hydroxy-6-metoxy-1,4-benzoquinol methylase
MAHSLSDLLASVPMPRDLELFRHLYEFRRKHPALDMKSFGALVSADQYRYLYEAVRTIFRPGWRVFDWGCGNGHFSYFLLRAGFRVTAFSFDGCPDLLREADREFPGRFDYRPGRSSEPVRIPAEDGEFDAVCSIGVLEHVRETGGDERKSLRELRRVMKPGAPLLVYHFPNRGSWIERAARVLTSQYTHPYLFTRQDVRTLCKDTGFDLLDVRTYGAFPRNVWRHFRSPILNYPRAADAFNRIDEALERLVKPMCQNHFFVAVKN